MDKPFGHRIWAGVKRINLREVVTYIICVMVAMLLWYAHAMNSVRNARVNVNLVYIGIPANIAMTTPLPTSVQVEVRDAGNRLRVYRRDPLKLTIDLSNQFKKKRGEVHISEDILRRGITDLLQGTSKLQQVIPEDIRVAYDTQSSKEVSITLASSYAADREYQLVGEPQLSQTKVTIYGQAQQLDTIRTIYSQALHQEGLRDSVEQRLALVAPAGVRLSQDTITVRLYSDRVTEKVLTMPIRTRHVPEDKTLRIFPQEVSVTLCVSMAHFTQVTADDIHVEAFFPQTGAADIALRVRYTNPYIYNARVNPAHVEYIIEQNNQGE